VGRRDHGGVPVTVGADVLVDGGRARGAAFHREGASLAEVVLHVDDEQRPTGVVVLGHGTVLLVHAGLMARRVGIWVAIRWGSPGLRPRADSGSDARASRHRRRATPRSSTAASVYSPATM